MINQMKLQSGTQKDGNSMTLRDMIKMYSNNDGTRTLFESIAMTEVEQALKDWNINFKGNYVLIGGVAVSYHAKPRVTMDIDVLFLSKDDIPVEVPGFKRIGLDVFRHNGPHVEVKAITLEHMVTLPVVIANKVFKTAIESNGIKIASPSALVVLKLHRMGRYDEGDIWALIETGEVDLTDWPLTPDKLEIYNYIVQRVKNQIKI